MFCTRKRAATDSSLLGLKGGTCGFIAAARGCCLSHKSSKGYNCWTARSTRDFPDGSTARSSDHSIGVNYEIFDDPQRPFSSVPFICLQYDNVTDGRCISLAGVLGTESLTKAAQILLGPTSPHCLLAHEQVL